MRSSSPCVSNACGAVTASTGSAIPAPQRIGDGGRGGPHRFLAVMADRMSRSQAGASGGTTGERCRRLTAASTWLPVAPQACQALDHHEPERVHVGRGSSRITATCSGAM